MKFAAERAGVSRDTIRRIIADGTLAAYRFRGQIRIALEETQRCGRSTDVASRGPAVRTGRQAVRGDANHKSAALTHVFKGRFGGIHALTT
ncbi:excisionase family DNA-binding protein [Nocardia sp. NPDC050378]|uniref:excisionase family DNA-binding protein n=1 Tax=Nocardia sp. NPDC050378 TaxID=3155400 RepID=UPI00340D416D